MEMKKQCLFILWLLSIFCGAFLYGQSTSTEYYFKRISIEHGLSQSGVTALVRDYKGLLWVGTRQGINRVDRNHIKKYTDSYIFGLLEDAQQQLWAITPQGVLRYDTHQDAFLPVLNERIFSICATEKGVFFGGYATIYQYHYDSKKIESLGLQKDAYARNKECLISHLTAIDEDTFLIGTESDGLYKYQISTRLLSAFITENASPLSSMYYDRNRKEVYYSIFQKGLYRYSLSGRYIGHYDSSNTNLSNDILLDIKPYRGDLWLATDGGGVSIFNPEKGSFRNIQHSAGNVHSLPVNSITVLYEDGNHNMWAGTVRDGVFLFKETYIKTYTDSALGSSNGLSERAVISLYEANDGIVWIGTDGGGINAFNPITERFTHHLNTYPDKVSSITYFSPNALLVSLYGKGLFVYETELRRYTPFILVDKATDQEECHSGFTPFVYRINDEQLLITAKNSYLYQLQKKTFTQLPFERGVSAKIALQFRAQEGNHLYFSKDNILYHLSLEKPELGIFLTLEKGCDISSVCYSKERKTFWIATTEGLYSYDSSSKKLSRTSTDKLFKHISYMQLDGQERLWLNASNVLFSYHIPHKKIMIWDDSDGFLPNDMLTGYVQTLPSSPYLYMGGVGGFVKINKGIRSEEGTPPLLFLQDIELNGKLYTVDNFPKEIPPYSNTIKINVGLKDKDLFRRILFRFKIKNKEQTSIIESYDNRLDISLLSVGDYEVSVACMSKDGNWTAYSTLLRFEVLPVWYQRPLFLIGITLLLLAIAGGLMWGYLRRKKQQLKWQIALHQQALNEEKLQFLTNVSHELRTPLTLIYAPLKRLLQRAEREEVAREERLQIESAFRHANTMKNIINWILDYNRTTSWDNSLSKSYTDLNHLISDCIKDFEQALESKHLQIVLDLDKHLPPIEIDVAKIRVVLSNLLMNALKFSNEHSTIYIRSSYDDKEERFQVENTGIGLQNIEIEKLFTRFEQGKHQQGGSGIGLAYCKELVNKHKGGIGAYQEGAVTVFYVTLPYEVVSDHLLETFEGEEAQSEAPDKALGSISTEHYSLLLVDDNADFLNYLFTELRPLFKSVLKAVNGEEALLLLKTHQPDLIVSDVMMPIMNGYQLCKEVKEQLSISHIPIILLTAKSDSESQKIGYKLGADAYLSKPFDIDLLLSVISNLLKQKEVIKQRYEKELLLPSPTLTTISNADEVFMIKLNDFIKEHYSDISLDVAMIADAMAMSRASIYNKMKQITGLGINEYVNKYRIEVACQLLKDTDKPVGDIAFEVGFNSAKYFSTAFKQAMGVSPREYRSKEENIE